MDSTPRSFFHFFFRNLGIEHEAPMDLEICEDEVCAELGRNTLLVFCLYETFFHVILYQDHMANARSDYISSGFDLNSQNWCLFSHRHSARLAHFPRKRRMRLVAVLSSTKAAPSACASTSSRKPSCAPSLPSGVHRWSPSGTAGESYGTSCPTS